MCVCVWGGGGVNKAEEAERTKTAGGRESGGRTGGKGTGGREGELVVGWLWLWCWVWVVEGGGGGLRVQGFRVVSPK